MAAIASHPRTSARRAWHGFVIQWGLAGVARTPSVPKHVVGHKTSNAKCQKAKNAKNLALWHFGIFGNYLIAWM